MQQTQNLPTLRIPRSEFPSLPDNDQWQFRFNIKSSSSDRIYTVAQHKEKKHWGCDCPGWKRHRKCQHLSSMGLPNHERPYEVKVIR